LKRKEDLKDLASKKGQGKNNVKASKVVVRNEIRVQTFGKLIQIHVRELQDLLLYQPGQQVQKAIIAQGHHAWLQT
jgi:hypothetical protein